MLPSQQVPCVFCPSPESHINLAVVLPGSGTDDIAICATCYLVCCRGSDKEAAELWHAFKEGTSAGYTDASFAQAAWRTYKDLGGFCSVLIANEKLDAASLDPKSGVFWSGEVPYLMVALPPSMEMRDVHWVLCRSRRPITPSMASAFAKVCPVFLMPDSFSWIDGRWAVATIPDFNEIGPQPAESLQRALITAAELAYGNKDFMLLVANKGASAGFEFIRRQIL